MAIRDLTLTPQQATPVPILHGGISRHEGDGPGYQVILLVDLAEREDLRELVEKHRSSQEGECLSVWGSVPEEEGLIRLILHFTEPVEAVAIFDFDIASHGKLVDALMQHALLNIVPGSPGDHLDDPAGEEEQPSLRVEVGAEYGSGWPEVWATAVANRYSVSSEVAARIVSYERVERDLRIFIPDSPPLESVVDLFRHPEGGGFVFVTDDMLLNQIRRDNPKIAEAFDAQFDAEMHVLSRDLSQTAGLIGRNMVENPESQYARVVGALLSNAVNGVAAAVELIRLGYRLQPAASLRVAVETAAVAIELTLNGDRVEDFLAGKVKSTDAITPAKVAAPFIGQLYGYLSEQFTHVGPLFGAMQPNAPYDDESIVAAKTHLLTTQAVLFLIGMAAELAFFDSVSAPRYWSKVGQDGFEFTMRPDVLKAMDDMYKSLSITEADDDESE